MNKCYECGSPVWTNVCETDSPVYHLYKGVDYFVFGHTQRNKPDITPTYCILDWLNTFF